MRVLGIETSCDETGIAIFDGEQGLIAHQLFSQTEIHAKYGGVVPELASRDHIKKILPLIEATLAEANLTPQDLNGVAYTCGPGLIGSLLVGATLGRALAFAWNLPSIGIHHLEGHLLAPMLEERKPQFPFLALLVSGGHTQLIQVATLGEYQIIGESIDDAAGEAFDKTAKLLGLPYPGGALLAKLAQTGNPNQFKFPRPMTDRPGLNFSFSGLKTAASLAIKQQETNQQTKADIAYAFEEAVIDTLTIKCRRALQQTGLRRLVVAGGVSANQHLRQALTQLLTELSGEIYFPRPEFCTDNGAMIAYAGYCRLTQHPIVHEAPLNITVKPRWSLNELAPLN